MENVADALKIAFAVMMFVIALTLSISSFSQATRTVDVITASRDREAQYTYVTPSSNLSRTVGIETVITSMYRAYRENIEIYFFESDGTTPLGLYYKTNNQGENIKENNELVKVNYIDSELESFGSPKEAIDHLDTLLRSNPVTYDGEYKNQIIYSQGLYKYLSDFTFKESFGEYYQGTGTTKIKKRVITYTKVQN